MQERKIQSENALKNAQNIKKIVPKLEEAKNYADWGIQAFSQIPDKPEFEIPDSVVEIAEAENIIFRNNYSFLSISDYSMSTTMSSIGLSGCMVSIGYFNDSTTKQVYNNGNNLWAHDAINSFGKIIEQQQKEIKVIAFVTALNNAHKSLVESIINDMPNVKHDITVLQDFCLRMRTVMEKVNGELKQRLPNKIGVQSGITNLLNAVCLQLVTSDTTSSEYILFQMHINTFASLWKTLSGDGKYNNPVTLIQVQSYYFQFIEILNAIQDSLKPGVL
ncbi:MAG: hypothetical protein JXA91_06310 [Candidatus Thermoplasmatota archaeon]|nr:hypothetical protein [Candidatus Thermoplasmatota archaeon]